MALTERLAYVLGVDVGSGVAGFERLSVSADKAAVAQAKVTVAADRVAVAEARVAVNEAKAAGDTEALAAATSSLSAARAKLAASSAEAKLVGAQGQLKAAEKDLAGVSQQSTAAGRAMQQFGLSGAGGALAVGVGVTAAGAAVAKFVKGSIGHFVDLTGQVRAFQRVTGGGAEESSQLVAAINVLGLDSDRAGTAVFRMAKNLDGQREALAKLGVTVATTADGNVDLTATFLNVADAVQAAGAGFKADEITAAAFGSRVGKDLLPILLRGRAGLQELFTEAQRHHEIFSQADLEKGRQLTLATRQLQQAFAGLEVEAGQALVPAATNITKASISVVEFTDNVGRAASKLHLFEPLVATLHLLSGASKSAGVDLAAAAVEAEKAAEATKEQTTALDGFVSATRAYTGATRGVESATKALADAQDAGTRKTKDQADAAAAARRADDDLRSAQEALTKAQRDAPANLARAHSDAAKAVDAEAKAVDAVTVAIEKYGTRSKQAKAAQDDLTAAQLDTVDAGKKAADLDAAGDRPPDVVAAEQQIAAAKKAQADAAEAKTKADKEDPVKELADAQRDLKDATFDELTARNKLNDAISSYNVQFQASVTIADVLDGKADDFLTKILDGSAALAKANADASALVGKIDLANQAAIGAGIVDPSGTTLGPQDATRANPAAPSTLLNARIGQPTYVTNVYLTGTNLTADDVGDAINRQLASSARSRAA